MSMKEDESWGPEQWEREMSMRDHKAKIPESPGTWEDFMNYEVYRAATMEFIISMMFCFISFATVITCLQANFSNPLIAISVVHSFLVAFFIRAALPASDGHFNFAITFTSMLTGHTSIPKGILYISFQGLGGIVGAQAVKTIIDPAVAQKFALGGCILRQTITIDGVPMVSGLSSQQGFISELAFTFMLLFIAYSMGFDPKRRPIYGPIAGILFVGIFVGLIIFISGGLRPGYVGAGVNPTRCLAAAVAIGNQVPSLWRDYWVFLVAPICGCMLMALVYHLVPWDHAQLYKDRESLLHLFYKNTIKEVNPTKYPRSSSNASSLTRGPIPRSSSNASSLTRAPV